MLFFSLRLLPAWSPGWDPGSCELSWGCYTWLISMLRSWKLWALLRLLYLGNLLAEIMEVVSSLKVATVYLVNLLAKIIEVVSSLEVATWLISWLRSSKLWALLRLQATLYSLYGLSPWSRPNHKKLKLTVKSVLFKNNRYCSAQKNPTSQTHTVIVICSFKFDRHQIYTLIT